ncbi:MAG: substrate-binding domain-containing protein [Anaerolineae bacterium]|nr:substrate-binding domain-containing protein [Anaerolineae bacterium]
MLRKATLLTLVLMMALGLAATSAVAQDGAPLVIGVLTDHSGALAVYGFEQTQGFELGLEYATDGTMQIGGRPVEIVVRDYAGDTDVAAQQARELIEVEGAEVLFGAPSSGVTIGLQQVAQDFETVLLMGPAAAASLTGELYNEYSFRACRNSYHDAYAIAAWAVANVGDTYVQLAADYAFGQSSAEAFEQAITEMGGTFVRDTIYAPVDTTDFTPYVQEVLDSGADGVITTWAGDSSITLFSQYRELGVFDQMYSITGFNSNDIVLAWSGPDDIGNVGLIVYHWSLPNNEANDWLLGNHILRYHDMPDLFTECGFASAQALVYGIERAITDGASAVDATLPEYLIPALEGLEWDGPKGHYTMRAEDHQVLEPMYVARLITLSGRYQAFYELVDEVLPDEYILPCLAPTCE